jgi:hypothetical protein
VPPRPKVCFWPRSFLPYSERQTTGLPFGRAIRLPALSLPIQHRPHFASPAITAHAVHAVACARNRSRVARSCRGLPATEPPRSRLPTTFTARRRIAIVSLAVQLRTGLCALLVPGCRSLSPSNRPRSAASRHIPVNHREWLL